MFSLLPFFSMTIVTGEESPTMILPDSSSIPEEKKKFKPLDVPPLNRSDFSKDVGRPAWYVC